MDHTLDSRPYAEDKTFDHEEGKHDEVLQMQKIDEIDDDLPSAEDDALAAVQEASEISEETGQPKSVEDAESTASPDGEADAEDEEALNRLIEELCMSKAEEFALLGYEGITGKDIWDFVSEQYQESGIPPLHRLINDILSLRANHYMNWLTLSAYKGTRFHE